MSEQPTYNIKQALEWFEQILKGKMPALNATDQLHVEIATTIEGYILKHARGALLVIFSGSLFPESLTKGSTVHLKRDILITVGVIVKYFSNQMLPAEYVDWVENTLSGFEVFSRRPANDRKTIPVKDELVSEENYEWRYLVTMKVPSEFFSADQTI